MYNKVPISNQTQSREDRREIELSVSTAPSLIVSHKEDKNGEMIVGEI